VLFILRDKEKIVVLFILRDWKINLWMW